MIFKADGGPEPGYAFDSSHKGGHAVLKVVLFDDEYIVVKGLEAMIDWEGYGLELAGTASDGIAALELFRRLRPSIIFTDIRMPGLDGLQLIETILQEAPDTMCVVFSGFNEFEYVKKAIQLGVADYLEKPVTVESIQKSIRKILDHIGKRQEADAMKVKWEVSRKTLLEKATLDLLMYGRDAVDKWKEISEVDRIGGVTVFASAAPVAFPLLEEQLQVQVRSGEEWWTAIFHLAAPDYPFWEVLLPTVEDQEVSVGSGRTYLKLEEAAESCREAVRALRSARFLGEKGVLRYEHLGDLMTSSEELSEREESIILSLQSGNKSALLLHVDAFLAWLRSERLEPEVAEHEMLKLIYFAMEEAKKAGGAELAVEWKRPHAVFREMEAKGQAAEWFRDTLLKLAERSLESREKSRHASVNRALAYILEHYGRDLSLSEVAEHVSMNPTYFSVLFKEETGESYIKYLTRYRMERAKTLLKQGKKVNEVSEQVGYLTYRHFSELFKKHTGLTPGQFRDPHNSGKEAD